jgi:hypothetical protein
MGVDGHQGGPVERDCIIGAGRCAVEGRAAVDEVGQGETAKADLPLRSGTGRLVAGLLDAGVPAGEVVAVVRAPGKTSDLAAQGVQVCQADYTDFAAATVAVLTPPHPTPPEVLELGGDQAWTLTELAAVSSEHLRILMRQSPDERGEHRAIGPVQRGFGLALRSTATS